jgi:hypothetical protein
MKRHSSGRCCALTTVAAICFTTLTVLSGGMQATGAVVTYPDRASWLAAIGSPTGSESFNGFTADASTLMAIVPIQNGTISSVDTSVFPNPSTHKIDILPFEYNTYFVDNTPYYLANTELTRTTTFQFTAPITAWAADFGRGHTLGIRSTPRIDLYDSANALLGSVTMSPDYSVPDEIQFYGFTITGGAASRLVLANSSSPGNRVFGIDNIEFVAVPEPSSFAVAALTMAIGLFRHRPMPAPPRPGG